MNTLTATTASIRWRIVVTGESLAETSGRHRHSNRARTTNGSQRLGIVKYGIWSDPSKEPKDWTSTDLKFSEYEAEEFETAGFEGVKYQLEICISGDNWRVVKELFPIKICRVCSTPSCDGRCEYETGRDDWDPYDEYYVYDVVRVGKGYEQSQMERDLRNLL